MMMMMSFVFITNKLIQISSCDVSLLHAKQQYI